MVKITLKTLSQGTFNLEMQDEETVAQLKSKIQEAKSFPVENQKLIYSGKVLDDARTIASLNFKEKDFLVVMVSKPKAAPAAPAPTPAASEPAASTSSPMDAEPTPASSSATETPAAPTSAPVTTSESIPAPTAESAANLADGASSFVTGSQMETAVQEMLSMGFPRDQVMRCLRASFNNPDRAVEYLMNGIPANLQQAANGNAQAPSGGVPSTPAPNAQTQATPAAPARPGNLFDQAARATPTATPTAAGAGAAGGEMTPAMMHEISALASNPAFTQLRQMVQQNPTLLPAFLAQLGQANPQLLALINANPAIFARLLQGEDLDTAMAAGPGGGEEGMDDLLGGGGGELPAGTIEVTPEEGAAIERLQAMGFDRNLCVQAFLACDRNEELAANYLIEHGFDDMED